MPFWILGIISKAKVLFTIANMATAAGFIVKWWRECLIIGLGTALLLGYWWHGHTIESLEIDLANAETNYANAKANADTFEDALDIIKDEIEIILYENYVLEDKVALANERITELESTPAEVVVRTIYEQTLPEQCEAKFAWMLNEAILMQDK